VEEVERVRRPCRRVTVGQPVFSVELKRVLESAFDGREAGAPIGTDHLLLGLHADESTPPRGSCASAARASTLALRMGVLRDPRRRVGVDRMRFIATSRWRLPL
jgi:hypothetical protein